MLQILRNVLTSVFAKMVAVFHGEGLSGSVGAIPTNIAVCRLSMFNPHRTNHYLAWHRAHWKTWLQFSGATAIISLMLDKRCPHASASGRPGRTSNVPRVSLPIRNATRQPNQYLVASARCTHRLATTPYRCSHPFSAG